MPFSSNGQPSQQMNSAYMATQGLGIGQSEQNEFKMMKIQMENSLALQQIQSTMKEQELKNNLKDLENQMTIKQSMQAAIAAMFNQK